MNLTEKEKHFLCAKEFLSYNPKSGLFTWIKINKNNNHSKIGSHAGGVDSKGYILISFNLKRIRAHQLAYLFIHGYIPSMIDHKNTIRADNRIENLRPANKIENGQNVSKPRKDNKLGIQGVYQFKNKFMAKICVSGKNIHLGTFDTKEEAKLMYDTKKSEYHPFAYQNTMYQN